MEPDVNYQNLVSQLQAIQSQVDIYKGGSPLDANLHINNIARTLSRDYGIGNIADIGVRSVDERLYTPAERVEVQEGSPYFTEATSELTGGKVNEFYNKNTGQVIPANKFASEGAGKGYSNYNLQAVPDGKGGMIAVPVQQYNLSGFSEVVSDVRPLIIMAAVALQVVPGLGQAVGYAVLGAGDVIAGAALAGEISTAAGFSAVTAASVAGSAGAATIAASVTAAQGGSAEDVIKAAAAAGSASIVNAAAGGGIIGAAAGSVVGTAVSGGDLDQIAKNAAAAAIGAGVAQELGPGAGAIATDLVRTGRISDQTLVKAAGAEIDASNKKPPAPIDERTVTPTTSSDINTQMQRLNLQQDLRDQLMNDRAFQEVSVLPVVAAGAQIAAEVGIPAIIRAAPIIAEYVGANMAREQIAAAIADVAGHGAALWYLNNLNNDAYFGQRFIPETGQTVTINLPPISEDEQSRLDKLYEKYQTTVAYIPSDKPNELDTVVIETKLTPEQIQQLSNPATAEAAASNIRPTVTTVKPNGQTTTQPATTTSGVISVNNVVPVGSQASGGAAGGGGGAAGGGGGGGAPGGGTPGAGAVGGETAGAAGGGAAGSGAGGDGGGSGGGAGTVAGSDGGPGAGPGSGTLIGEGGGISGTGIDSGSGITSGPGGGANIGPGVSPGEGPGVVPGVGPSQGPGADTGEGQTLGPGAGPGVEPVIPGTPEIPPELLPVTLPEVPPGVQPPTPPESLPPTIPEPLPEPEPEPEPPPERQAPPTTLYPTVTQTPRPKTPSYPTLAGPSPARLLADALAAYRPAGAIEGAESGKERQNVWNEKSLRLRDALGL